MAEKRGQALTAVCTPHGSDQGLLGCFYKLGVLSIGVLVIRALLFRVYIGGPEFGKLPLTYP